MLHHSFIDVRMDDGTYKVVWSDDIEQMFFDKETGDILIWFKEKGKMVCALAVYWGL